MTYLFFPLPGANRAFSSPFLRLRLRLRLRAHAHAPKKRVFVFTCILITAVAVAVAVVTGRLITSPPTMVSVFDPQRGLVVVGGGGGGGVGVGVGESDENDGGGVDGGLGTGGSGAFSNWLRDFYFRHPSGFSVNGDGDGDSDSNSKSNSDSNDNDHASDEDEDEEGEGDSGGDGQKEEEGKLAIDREAQKEQEQDQEQDQEQEQEQDVNSDFCSEKQYLDGSWELRPEIMESMDDVRRVWGLTDAAEMKCHGNLDSLPRTPQDPLFTARVLNVSQYEWKPASGCRKHSVDREGMIRRLLRSRAGLTLVGDSLSEHHYQSLRSILVSSDGLILSEITPQHEHRIWLKTDHPSASRIIESAGVSSSRAKDRPLVTFFRDHQILSRAEVDHIFRDSPGYIRQEERDSAGINQFVKPFTKWWTGWSALFEVPIEFTSIAVKEGVREEKNLVLFQLGPHWSKTELSNEMSVEEVNRGYEKAVALTVAKFETIPTHLRHLVSPYWRGNSPGDPYCHLYTEPINNRTDHFSKENPNAVVFNWNEYLSMNNHISSILSYTPSLSSTSLVPATHSSGFRYLDIWPLSIGRPDAHLKPMNDCMHYCMPSVPHEWMRFAWHLMVTDSVNDDYT